MTQPDHPIDPFPQPQRFRWFWAVWDAHHAKFGWITLGVLLGLMAGWWVGGLTSCVEPEHGCDVSVGAIEAAGTWFGAIGGLLAVGAGIATFRSAEEQRLDEQRRLLMSRSERDEADLEEAANVRIHCQVGVSIGDLVREIRASVVNNLSEQKIHKISGEWDGFGSLDPMHTLHPGKTHVTSFQLDSPRARPGGKVELCLPPREHAKWAQDQRKHVRITYELRGQWYERVGDAPPARISAPEALGAKAPGVAESAGP